MSAAILSSRCTHCTATKPPVTASSESNNEDDSDDEDIALYENLFEPVRNSNNMDLDQPEDMTAHHDIPHDRHAKNFLCAKHHIVLHPAPLAGHIIQEQPHQYTSYKEHVSLNGQNNIYTPFLSKLNWEVAKWAKLHGSGSTAFTDLLKIDGLVDALSLSYANSQQLNDIIDDSLPSLCLPFIAREVIIDNEAYEVYFCDILECVKALFGNPEFANDLVYSLERHYDMIEATTPGATIIPIIISSDKTQLTLFRNKSTYPVYLTIGNILKDIRRKPSHRAQILLGYLPTCKLENDAGVNGIQLANGHGSVYRGHPIFTCFVGDYPEQCLVTATVTGGCPKGETFHDTIGDYEEGKKCPHHDLDAILYIFEDIDDVGVSVFNQQCHDAHVRPIQHLFREDLPYVHIYQAITPDILHQLYQGVVKHIIAWVTMALGAAEIDACCRRLPPNHHLRIFHKGITTLSRVSGKEHHQVCSFLLGLVIDAPLEDGSSPDRLVTTVRALLDFLHLAQYSVHTNETLVLLCHALTTFHANKSIFVDLGVHEHFRIPKSTRCLIMRIRSNFSALPITIIPNILNASTSI
ncbi:Para aminobenzoic acid synthetase [Salix suchowensis]|nr:Para aminobenzoic acid synthetase [Salix suchowensis]